MSSRASQHDPERSVALESRPRSVVREESAVAQASANRPGRRRRFLIRSACLLAGLLFALLAGEAAVRIVALPLEVSNPLYSFHASDPTLGWVGAPGVARWFRRPEFRSWVEHGADGWRVPRTPPAASAAKRVLFLGDSFTWGWGVSQGEVFTDALQARQADVAVVNRGVNAFGSAQELLLLRAELERAEYSDVVVMFYANDVGENVDGRKGRRPYFVLEGDRLVARNVPAQPLTTELTRWLKDHSRLYLGLEFQLDAWKRARKEPKRGDDDAGSTFTPAALEVTSRILREMREVAGAHGARLFVVRIPGKLELARAADAPSTDVERMLSTLAESGIVVVDLLPPLREAARAGRRLAYEQDAHWTRDGHAVVAEFLARSPIFRAPRRGEPDLDAHVPR